MITPLIQSSLTASPLTERTSRRFRSLRQRVQPTPRGALRALIIGCFSLSITLSATLILSLSLSGCVVKEELDNTYNQAHLGLNQWDLKATDQGSYTLNFNIGYLIGLVDDEGVKGINWRYELMTRDLEVLGSFSEEMREATPDKEQIFVEGRRTRALEPTTVLSEGETYVLWFTLYYNDEILHEQLFPVIAGGEGGDPYWIEELIGERLSDEDLAELGLLDSNTQNNAEMSAEMSAETDAESSDETHTESSDETSAESSDESPAMEMTP